MAKIKIFCPHCGQSLQCDESNQGKQVRCPPCGQLFLVPQMPLHTTPDEATAFRNDFFKRYPDLLPYESVVDAVAVKLQASGHSGVHRFADVTVNREVVEKLQASGYKGGIREAVMEVFAKAARQELARQQQTPPIISETQVPTDVGSNKASETAPQKKLPPWKRANKAFGFGFFVGVATTYSVKSDLSSPERMLAAGNILSLVWKTVCLSRW